MRTATLIKMLPWNGVAALYKLSRPVYYDENKSTYYVIVSTIDMKELMESVDVPGDALGYESETAIFPAKLDGEPINFGDLVMHRHVGNNHLDALRDLGDSYEAVDIYGELLETLR